MRNPILDIRHLQMIRAIGRTGRVVDASDELGLTPSALSHRIKEAERRLGVPLFERLHKRLRMTAAAEYLASVSERMLHELVLVEDDVRRMNAGVDHVVRLAIEAYSCYHWFPAFLDMFRRQAERIDIQVMSGAGQDTNSALLNRHVDVVIVSGEEAPPNTRYFPLFDDPLVFICAPSHPLGQLDRIHARDIEGQNFITYTKVPEPDREFARLFRVEGRYPRWSATLEIPEAIVELVAADQGTSILASWAMEPHVKLGRILAKPLAPGGINVKWGCRIRSDDPSGGAVFKVADALVSWFSES
ncbi:MAG: LysR family transcriptional regulator [Pseudomonadota bacterium]